MNFNNTLLVLAGFGISLSVCATPKDSVGMERKGKNTLVLHKIESGETLFSIARRYHASLSAIKSENPGLGDALKLGGIVKVPYTATGSRRQNSLPAGSPTVAGQAGISANPQTHTVANGESLYSIARKYNISVSRLKQINNIEGEELQIGQQLAVGATGKTIQNRPATAESRRQNSLPARQAGISANPQTHTVANGEGLYSIARKYNISVADLKKWNAMDGENLNIGQEINVSAPGASGNSALATTVVQTPAKTIETVAPTVSAPVIIAAKPILSAPANPDSAGSKPETSTDRAPIIVNNSGYVKTTESGLAEAITDGGNSDLFLALHRTAPVGTIMQVRNEMNDQSVFVKVIGSLPDTGENDKVVVKISRRAYERLAAVDKRFRVQLSYMPQQ